MLTKAGFVTAAAVGLAAYLLPYYARLVLLTVAALFAAWLSTPTDNGGQADVDARQRRSLLTEKFHASKVPADLDAIVIGAGMSGLNAAAVLSRLGKRVLVVEQHDTAGGGTHMYTFKKGDHAFKFDSGLHYVVPWSGPIMDLVVGGDKPSIEFALMGEPDGTFDKIVLGDDPPFALKHKEAHMRDLYALFPEDKAALDEYIQISNRVLNSIPMFGLSKFFPLRWQKIYSNLVLGTFRKYAGQTTKELLQKLTPNKKLQAMLASLWIDTGSPPHKATFMLSAAVFRGLPIEGGAYPTGGSDEMARCLIPVVERSGGKVLMVANVDEITFDDTTGAVTGVTMQDGTHIPARTVISSAGYPNTFTRFVPEKITTRFNIPRTLPISNSAGFVMCNVGIVGRPADLDITCANLWYHPIKDHGYGYDLFAACEDFFQDPLKYEPPVMITFPSMKDRAWEKQFPTTIVCQILVMAEYAWFEKWHDRKQGQRGDEYMDLKKQWEEKCLDVLYKFYPKVRGHVEFVDVSTPLSIEHYLSEPEGGAVGLDQVPERFTNWEIQKHLDISTPVPGLWLAGQDTLICGQPLVQLGGIIAGVRVAGWRGVAGLLGWAFKGAFRKLLIKM